MIKVLSRALLIAIIIVVIGTFFWYHPIITPIFLVCAWLAVMIYLDPPSKWN